MTKNKTTKNKTTKNKTTKNKTTKNKTFKNKLINKKTKFIQNILKEWKKQTTGFIEKDKTIYKNDYYLDLNDKPNYNNHIHLILKNFAVNHNTNDNILYMMKKYHINDKKVIHSTPFKININSDPKIIVRDMIKNYDKFIN